MAPVLKKPALARAEVVDKATRGRLEAELDAALKRRPTSEVKLAGVLRALSPLSPALRASMAEALSVMLRRGSNDRDLYGATLRSLGEAGDRQAATLVKAALLNHADGGGSAAMSAACFSREPELGPALAKIAASRQSHLAFGAETARVVRGESSGAHLASLAPMIKESHRIALCVELFVPLARSAPVSVHVAPALAVLRGAERHLGRWLVLAQVAVKAGDRAPLDEAQQKASTGPSSARAAWSLVAWSLQTSMAGGAAVPVPPSRPNVELVARLSDRPSANRDTTFLFRLAHARAASAKPMLEALVKAAPLADEVSVRAALFLARDHGRDDLREQLLEVARNGKRDDLRGPAVAALWDVGMTDRARELTDELLASRSLGNVAWGALVRAAAARAPRDLDDLDAAGKKGEAPPVLSETPLRWIQWGWLE